jgi:hypothetical protein
MGEYFAAQSGVGQYEQAAAGMGEYFAAQGLGEFFAYTPPGMQGLGGPLVNWARQEEAEAGHAGIFGLGEYFGANGLGAMAPLTDEDKKSLAMYAGGGAVAGLLVASLMKKTKPKGLLVGGGLGAALGAGAFYAMRPAA